MRRWSRSSRQHNPDAHIVAGGDLNVYPRPDDPFAPIGQPGSSDQLGALYAPSLGLKNLWEVLLSQAPESAYSYVYNGMAQTLDQMFLNQRMLAGLHQFRTAHINSDFPADYPGDVARGTSDHDPNVANFVIFNWNGFFRPVDNLPALNVAKAGSSIPLKFSLSGDQGLNIIAAGYPKSTMFACDTLAPQDPIEQTASPGSSGLSYNRSHRHLYLCLENCQVVGQFLPAVIDPTGRRDHPPGRLQVHKVVRLQATHKNRAEPNGSALPCATIP